jgi:hypothetical protein
MPQGLPAVRRVWFANKCPVLGTLVSEVKIHTTFIGGKKRFRSREIYQRGEE